MNLRNVLFALQVAKLAGVPDGFFVGAAAGPFHVIGTNSEVIIQSFLLAVPNYI